MLRLFFATIVLAAVVVAEYDTCSLASTVAALPFTYSGYTDQNQYSNYSCSLFNLFTRSKGAWFKFQGDGRSVTARTCDASTDFDTIIYVFTSCSNGAGATCVAYNDDYCDTRSQVTWSTASGTLYYVFVTGFATNVGHYDVEIFEALPPDNYQCSAALQIAAIPFFEQGVTDICTPVQSYCQSQSLPGLWYKLTGTGQVMKADTCDEFTTYDTQLEVYEGSCQTCLVFNDDSCGTRSAVVFQTKLNVVYYIFVTGFQGSRGTFYLNLQVVNPSAHSNCGTAYVIPRVPFVHSDTNANMPQSYSNCASMNRHTYWFTVHGQGTELYAATCQTDNFIYDTVVEVYDSCVANVGTTCVAQNDDFCGIHSAVKWMAEAEKDYFIAVSGFRVDVAGGNFSLIVNEADEIANDQCWGAEAIMWMPWDTSQQTYDCDPSVAGCDYNQRVRIGRWYTYTHSGDTIVLKASTCDAESSMTTNIEIYTSCTAASCIAEGSHSCTNYPNQSEVTWTVRNGGVYNIYVSGVDEAARGFFHIDIFPSEPNPYGTCADARVISRLPASVEGVTSNCQYSHSSCENAQKQGEWFRLTGTGHKIVAHTCNMASEYDTFIQVYSSCAANNSCVGFNDDGIDCGRMSYYTWNSVAGVEYWIFVTGYGTQTGIFVLDVIEDYSPQNALCLGAPDVSKLLPYTVTGHNAFVNPSYGDCDSGMRKGLWYTVAGYNQTLRAHTCNPSTNFDTEIEVYKACDVSGGKQCMHLTYDFNCGGNSVRASVSWFAQEHAHQPTYYWIFVTGLDEAEGFFQLDVLDVSPTPSSDGKKDDGLSGGAVVGIVFGVIFGIAALGAACVGGYMLYKKYYPMGYTEIGGTHS